MKSIESSHEISKPGTGVKILAFKLTPEAQKRLSLNKEEEQIMNDDTEITKLQRRDGFPIVALTCVGLLTYLGVVLAVAFG